MAADWIMMRVDLAEDPAVIFIADRLNMDVDLVVGKLFRLWKWANVHTTNGNAVGVTKTWVDAYLRAEGFASAMIGADWLRERENGIVFPRYERWNSKSSKKRALTARRQEAFRKRTGRYASVTREEKRREEEHTPTDDQDPPSPSGARRPKSSRARRVAKTLVVPSVEQVAAYCTERRNGIEAEEFIDHYTQNGWCQKNGQPIVDWEAAVRNWERMRKKFPRHQGPHRGGTNHSGVREWIEESHADGTLYDQGGQ